MHAPRTNPMLSPASDQRPRRSRASGSRRGFSLVEIVICIIIMGVVAGLAIPRLTAALDARQASAGARRLALDLTLERQAAIASGVTRVSEVFGGPFGPGGCESCYALGRTPLVVVAPTDPTPKVSSDAQIVVQNVLSVLAPTNMLSVLAANPATIDAAPAASTYGPPTSVVDMTTDVGSVDELSMWMMNPSDTTRDRKITQVRLEFHPDGRVSAIGDEEGDGASITMSSSNVMRRGLGLTISVRSGNAIWSVFYDARRGVFDATPGEVRAVGSAAESSDVLQAEADAAADAGYSAFTLTPVR